MRVQPARLLWCDLCYVRRGDGDAKYREPEETQSRKGVRRAHTTLRRPPARDDAQRATYIAVDVARAAQERPAGAQRQSTRTATESWTGRGVARARVACQHAETTACVRTKQSRRDVPKRSSRHSHKESRGPRGEVQEESDGSKERDCVVEGARPARCMSRGK